MKRRKWKPEQKALIVLEGLKGRPIGELCVVHKRARSATTSGTGESPDWCARHADRVAVVHRYRAARQEQSRDGDQTEDAHQHYLV